MDPLLAQALDLDLNDPLAKFRAEFVENPGLIYLDGNSLGKMPLRAKEIVRDVADRQWGDRLIRSWGEGWYTKPQALGAKIARLIGAQPDEVIVTDSTSVNFFKLAVAALRARPGRRKIVSETFNFPSDIYLLQGVADLLPGHDIVLAESADEIHLPAETVESHLDADTALLTLSHTSFKSAFLHDMKRLTAAAQAQGALTLWDLSHSAGAISVDLNGVNADLAVGCCYKYLSGGPGAPAFLYVRRDLQEALVSPIWGWFGQSKPFDFALDYTPAAGVDRFLAGTPPILSMSAIEAGVDLLLEAGMEVVRAKSVAQTEFLIRLIDERLALLGVEINSPRDLKLRGSHISIRHPEAWRINCALIEKMGVIPDFRRPDNIRLGIAPLYTSFEDIYRGVEAIRIVITERRFEKYPAEAAAVT